MIETVTEVASKKTHIAEGISVWKNAGNRFVILDLGFVADPAKRSEEWRLQSQAGMPKSEWEREYGNRWIVHEGKQVYPEYDESMHLMRGNIVAPRRSRLVCGWDGGPNDLNLAWVLGIIAPDDLAATWIDEHTTEDGDLTSFVEVVSMKLNLEWRKLGGFIIHIADQSVFTKSNVVSGGKAMADIMREYNMSPMPGEISFSRRRTYVKRAMITHYKSKSLGVMVPRWRVHERCVKLREAMDGGYCYPKRPGAGATYHDMPAKNIHSHIANAMEYAVSRLSVLSEDVPYGDMKKMPKARIVGMG